jgi:hypothetical protein
VDMFLQNIFSSNAWIKGAIFGFLIAFIQIISEHLLSKIFLFLNVKVNKSPSKIKLFSCILNLIIFFSGYGAFLYLNEGKNIFLEIYGFGLTNSIKSLIFSLIIGFISILIVSAFFVFIGVFCVILYGLYVKFPEIKKRVTSSIYK